MNYDKLAMAINNNDSPKYEKWKQNLIDFILILNDFY